MKTVVWRHNSVGKKTGRSIRAGKTDNGAVSVSALRAARAVDALTPAFVRWYDDGTEAAAVVALAFLEVVKDVTAHYFRGAAAPVVTSFDPDPFAAALDAVLDQADDEDGEEFVIGSVHTFIDFLTETENWTGTEAQLHEIHEILHGGGGGVPSIQVPVLDENDELEALAKSSLVQRVTALLHWLGTGKPVTATGQLRLKDIEPAAASIGIAARGAAGRKTTQLPLFADVGDDVSDDTVPTVRSMLDVPLLPVVWAVLESADLIAISSTTARPAVDAEGFLHGGPAERLLAYRLLVTEFFRRTMLDVDPRDPWQASIAALQMAVLIAATTPQPPEVARVSAVGDHAADDERMFFEAASQMSMDKFRGLAELGLMEVDTQIRVPPAIVRCVADAFNEELLLAGSPAEEMPAQGGMAAKDTAPVVTMRRPVAGPVLQLKIMLKGSKPPIWRRLLVPSVMPLSQLHHVLQTSFGWLDYHLHHFQVGGHRGTTYGPADTEVIFGDPPIDESTVSIGQLLTTVGNTVTYTYDFGDNWEHMISLEKILPEDDGGVQVRSTGGRGAGPAEDSGGVWGWVNIVEAANDPSHENHGEYRDWLGLAPGETLDLKEFDQHQLNEDLADLF
ncbi:plasmid pRiA4b ORF-3 family protein [Pseudarthrobacter sp. S9]|uniref:plasmid pRiA4b ORF-3 family protein n=1 Tax=Pseudarthrobacter sp. S9 TaxID=3418421 RepID=UPI003D0245DF